MLPIRLEMRNFLAYRAPDALVFEDIALACLTGPNGVGKSSILDAITWALWGRARAKRDEDLIHLGQNEMVVGLDFEQDGTRYRVRRRRARAGRGSRGSLDLMILADGALPRIINDAGLRRTQDKLNGILRLDYETFVHSAFLQQGRADAFTRKTAAERKRLLAEILGLDQWRDYAATAKSRLSRLESQIDIIEHDLRNVAAEIAREPQLRAELDALAETRAALRQQLDLAERQYRERTEAADALRRENERLAEQAALIASRREDIEAAQAEIARQEEQIAAYQRTIAQTDSIEAGYQQLQTARLEQSAIAEQVARAQELDRRRHQLEAALEGQRARLQREADVIRERISGLEKLRRAAPAVETEKLRREIAELQELDARRNTAVSALRRLGGERERLATHLAALTAEGRAISERLGRLEQVDGAICPLCGGALTVEQRHEMLRRLEEDWARMRDEYRRAADELRDMDQRRERGEDELEAWALRLKDLPALQQRLGAADEQGRLAQGAEEDLARERQQLAQIEARLAEEDFGEDLRRQLAELADQRARIGFDPDSPADAKTQLERLAEFDRQHAQLALARHNLPEARRIQADTALRLQKMQGMLAQAGETRQNILAQIEALEAQTAGGRDSPAELERLRGDMQRLDERRTIYEQELRAIAAGRESRKRLEHRLGAARRERSLFNELRAAFGRNGLPAQIIETVTPELETEANALLRRMTAGRMSLRLISQREKQSGGLAETLDIEIADSLGERAYELYSGGEAFRINFAIRIALSKLLARRAGAQLRTLFIDEGFGSQDEDGRDKLVEAISAVRGDFDLILVITHIDELRDAFPVHLLVEKTPAGSIVTIR